MNLVIMKVKKIMKYKNINYKFINYGLINNFKIFIL